MNSTDCKESLLATSHRKCKRDKRSVAPEPQAARVSEIHVVRRGANGGVRLSFRTL